MPGRHTSEGAAGGERDAERAQLLAVHRLVRALGSSSDLAPCLQELATEVSASVGFDAVAVHLSRADGTFEVVAVDGASIAAKSALRGRTTDRATIETLMARSVAWGSLRFVAGDGGDHGAADAWAPGEATWHPQDVLLAPMRSPAGKLLAVLSLDRPSSGLRPTGAQCALLEILAALAALTIEDRTTRAEVAEVGATYRAAVELVAHGIAVLDASLCIVTANKGFAELVGRPASALVGRPLEELADDELLLDELRRAGAPGVAMPSHDHRIRRADGGVRRVRTSACSVWGEHTGRRIVLRCDDVEAERRASAELNDHATADVLTGLPNRRSTVARLATALAGRARGHYVAIVVVEIDGVARIDEGRDVATRDASLVSLARALEAMLRADEHLYRVSDEGFAVLCEQLSSAQSADVVAERLVGALRRRVTTVAGQSLSGRAGVALVGDATAPTSASSVLAAAEAAARQALGQDR